MNKKVLFLIPGLLISASVLIAITPHTVKNTVQPAVTQEVTPVAPTEPVTPTVTPVDATITPAPVDTTPVPSAPVVAPAPAPAPITYKFAADMASVGIAESDYSYVTDTVLDDNGWRVTGDKVWRKAVDGSSYTNLHDKLLFANNYVVANYGTWKAAYDSYVNRGNF